MAKPGKNDSDSGVKSDGPSDNHKGFRCADDLELLKIILEDNPRLKSRVLYLIESALGKRASE